MKQSGFGTLSRRGGCPCTGGTQMRSAVAPRLLRHHWQQRQLAVLTTRPADHGILRRRRLTAVAVAAPGRATAGAAPRDQQHQQYQGREGRDRLWEDINVDEYPEGQYPTDEDNAYLQAPWGAYLMLAASTKSAVTGTSPGWGAGFPIKAAFGGPAGEVLRPDRSKIFHGHGIHRLATFSATPNNGLTGLLAADCVPLLVRLSLAHRADDMVPGFAAFWFPENAAPGSIVLVPTLDQDYSRRFFSRDFLHALPPMWQPPPLYLRSVLALAKPGGSRLSVDHLARVDAQGQPVTAPSTGISLKLRPASALDKRSLGKDEDFREYLKEMTEGETVLFNILVHEKGPGFFSKGVDREVGTISFEPDSEWKVSAGGDRRLFFPHFLPGEAGGPPGGACPAGR